jgi:hypothetical protein
VRPGLVAVVMWGAAVATACSGGAAKPSLDARASSTTLATPNGKIVIGETTYEFVMTCYAPGTGAVVAVGNGTDPASGRVTRALVQAFFGDPYVGVTVGNNETVYEPSLDETIDLYYQQDVVRGGAIQFVKNLDLQAHTGEAAGLGSVTVSCPTYRPGLPPGYGS